MTNRMIPSPAIALTEAGRPDLAALINLSAKSGLPIINWSALDRLPTLADIIPIKQALALWYITFRPDIENGVFTDTAEALLTLVLNHLK